jgi:ADP-heptose:LPS heptosyltransferase
LFFILKRPVFYFARGLRKLDNNLTIGLLRRIAKSSRGRHYDSPKGRIVFILENIGDTIGATPVLNRLTEDDWVVCTKYNRAVMEMLGLKNVIALHRDPGIFDLIRIFFRLRKKSFAASVVLDHTRAGDFGVLVSRLLKTGVIVSGFGTTVKGDIHTDKITADDGNTDILTLAKVSIAAPVVEVGDIRKEIKPACDTGLDDFRNYIGVHIGGFGSVLYGVSRQYPGEHTAELIEMLLARGYRIVITGDRSDARDFRKFSTFLGKNERFVNLAGRLNLNELGCLFKALKCYITPDNGTLHLAQAVGCKKIFAVLGSSSPALVRGRNTEIIRMDLPCSPCLEFLSFPSRCVNAQKNACLDTLRPGVILDRVVAYMGRGA